MLQNIRILAGEPPRLTGNSREDAQSLERFNRDLMDALAYSLEQLDRRLEKVEERENG